MKYPKFSFSREHKSWLILWLFYTPLNWSVHHWMNSPNCDLSKQLENRIITIFVPERTSTNIFGDHFTRLIWSYSIKIQKYSLYMLLQSQVYMFCIFGGETDARLYILLNFILLDATYQDISEFLFCHATYLVSSTFISSLNGISIPLNFSSLWFYKMLNTQECSNQVGVITFCEGLSYQ